MIGGPGEGNLLTRTLRDERNRRERGRRQGDEKVYLARDVGLEGIIVLGRMAAEHGRVPMQAIAVSEEGVGSVGEARAGVDVDGSGQGKIAADNHSGSAGAKREIELGSRVEVKMVANG